MRAWKTSCVPVRSWDSKTRWSLSRIITIRMCLSCHQSTQWIAPWNSGVNPSIRAACSSWRLTADYAWHHQTLTILVTLLVKKNRRCSSVLCCCISNLVRQLEPPQSDLEVVCNFISMETKEKIPVQFYGFHLLLVHCLLKMCLFGTGPFPGLWYCCLQFSRKPFIWTTQGRAQAFGGAIALTWRKKDYDSFH